MKQKASDRDRQVRKSMQFRLLTLEALIASQLPPLTCPERMPSRCDDGRTVECGKPASIVVEIEDLGIWYGCRKCSQFYVGTRREIDATDLIRIATERMWSDRGDD